MSSAVDRDIDDMSLMLRHNIVDDKNMLLLLFRLSAFKSEDILADEINKEAEGSKLSSNVQLLSYFSTIKFLQRQKTFLTYADI